MAGLRVVVAVTPRLLGDALCHALASGGLDVTSADLDGAAESFFDIAVVSLGRESDVSAARVLTVPEDGSGPSGLSTLALLRQALADGS